MGFNAILQQQPTTRKSGNGIIFIILSVYGHWGRIQNLKVIAAINSGVKLMDVTVEFFEKNSFLLVLLFVAFLALYYHRQLF
jgi:hypothetical protein